MPGVFSYLRVLFLLFALAWLVLRVQLIELAIRGIPSICLSVNCACGWNTSARCFANTVLFVCCFLSIFFGLVFPSIKGETLV